jgi:ubiquinone/menaquinone biosynthesis C-methylase UbiE
MSRSPLYERAFAAVYDRLASRAEESFGAELKQRLLTIARGRVLEIGVGTGLSLEHYPPIDELVAIDPSEPMLRRAEARAAELNRTVTFLRAAAEALPFADDSFDTVVSLAVLCTVDDPLRALAEIHRVLRPAGCFIFLEHVRSADRRTERWQDRLERPWGWIAGGCHPNRRTVEAIEAAGFELTQVEPQGVAGLPRLLRPLVTGTAVAR